MGDVSPAFGCAGPPASLSSLDSHIERYELIQRVWDFDRCWGNSQKQTKTRKSRRPGQEARRHGNIHAFFELAFSQTA